METMRSKDEENAILARYKSLVKKATSAFDLTGMGNSDDYIDIVRVQSTDDIDAILNAISVIEASEIEDLDWELGKLTKAMEADGYILIGCGANCDYIYIVGTPSDVIANVSNALNPKTL